MPKIHSADQYHDSPEPGRDRGNLGTGLVMLPKNKKNKIQTGMSTGLECQNELCNIIWWKDPKGILAENV